MSVLVPKKSSCIVVVGACCRQQAEQGGQGARLGGHAERECEHRGDADREYDDAGQHAAFRATQDVDREQRKDRRKQGS